MNETDKKLDYFIINVCVFICVIHVTDMKYYLSKLNTYENINMLYINSWTLALYLCKLLADQ